MLLVDADLPAGDAVVGELAVDVDEIGAEEADFLQHVIADGEDAVAIARRLHQGMLVEPALIAEDVFEVDGPGRWRCA